MDGVLGLVALVGAKFFAYGFYLRLLSKRWAVARNPWLWSLARLALGVVVGMGIYALMAGDGEGNALLSGYVLMLGAGRVLAWSTILVLAFGGRAPASAIALATVIGVLLSYAVEIPILLGLFRIMGGIC
jgi:hypothetical protein